MVNAELLSTPHSSDGVVMLSIVVFSLWSSECCQQWSWDHALAAAVHLALVYDGAGPACKGRLRVITWKFLRPMA
jgi:hypothetical protein